MASGFLLHGLSVHLGVGTFLVASAVTAAGMHYGLDWDWGSAAVFGVLIALVVLLLTGLLVANLVGTADRAIRRRYGLIDASGS